MEVTRKNFREVLAELESTISSSDFLAIDGEFTGLHSTGQDVNAFDTPSQYYTKLRSSCMDYLLVQFGLCIFKYDEKNRKYTHRAYNFYIFPRPQNRSGPDPRFLCQSSSIEFLASQGFDFNKLFKEGIPYLTQPEEQKMRENLEEKHKYENSTSTSTSSNGEGVTIPIPEQHVAFIEDVCSQIEKFLQSPEPEELELDRCNAFLRKLVFQEVRHRFDSSKIVLESRLLDNRNRVLVVTRTGSEEAQKEKEKAKMERELQELEDAVGFSSVVKKISESGKLVIGHNMLLDICHVVHQCCFPLPPSYSEFKELIACVFPKLIDTKYMSYSSVFKESINSNVLEHLHKTLSEKPFKLFTAEPEGEGLGYSSISEKYHEAGYDAYITGLCYIAMASYIGSLENPEMFPVLSSSPLLNPYMNKLFLVRVQDSPYMNLVGKDPEPPRNHVFHITFPKDWKTSDITQLFNPYGSVFIAWISETSAFVALYKRDQAAVVKKNLMQSDKYTLMTYAAYQELQNGRKTKCRCGLKGSRSMCSECSDAVKKVSSPSLAKVRKRQKIEADPEIPMKRNKSSYSNRGIEAIPEEEEEEEVDRLDNTAEVSSSHNDPDTGASSITSLTVGSSSTMRKKEFDENDSWG